MNPRISAHIIRRTGLFTAAAIVAVAPLATAPAGASASSCVSWTGVQPPNPGTSFNELTGVTVLSACNAWAVGAYSSGSGTSQTLILHWNGSSWKQVASPNPTARNVLIGVAALSATNIWAVGSSFPTGSGGERTLIVHWNGTAWKQVASPNPSPFGNILTGVAATSATNAWAVGLSLTGGPERPLILHWNGTVWKRVKSPTPNPRSDNVLNGVAATSARNAWAVGYYLTSSGVAHTLIEHWNGTAWKQVASPNPSSTSNVLIGVAASSAGTAWAVGSYDSGTVRQTFALHCC